MAYDEGLAARVRIRLEDRPGYAEKKMFGGLCFLLNGNMSCGISGDRLMARVGPEAWEEALSEPGAREMDFTGRSLKGFVYVDEDVLRDDAVLDRWVDRAAGFAGACRRSDDAGVPCPVAGYQRRRSTSITPPQTPVP